MDRIAEIFTNCAKENRSALILFVSAGYPDMAASEAAAELAIEQGADILELGVPFSDPIADGPVIAQASKVALANGINLAKVLQLAKRIRARHPKTGLILFSYLNVMYHYSLAKLTAKLSEIDMDGILAVDLPLEERDELSGLCRQNHLHLISLVTPATPEERVTRIMAGASGFLYYVSVRGVTGARKKLPSELKQSLDLLRSRTTLPVAVGFGISDGATAAELAPHADGIIVGSAFLEVIGDPGKAEKLLQDLRGGCQK
ncbi:MAG: tryptophan synthase subunit alpha [Victivallaceae bacterium]|nr:tryptophan synthase subunit alpha [Victivallaceae bacterium]